MSDTTPAAVRVSNISHHFGSKQALDRITLACAPGEIFTLLGPNGAGKTTLISIIQGYLAIQSGEVMVLGEPPSRNNYTLRKRWGTVLQDCALPRLLTVQELLSMYAGYFPDSRNPAALLEQVGLAGNERRRVRQLSGGQQRRLEIALCLIGNPSLLLLDEPTSGLDPEGKRDIWKMLAEEVTSGTTILLTTHDMEEAEILSSRVCVLVGGRIVAMDTPDAIRGNRLSRIIRFSLVQHPAIPLPTLTTTIKRDETRYQIESHNPTKDPQMLTSWALQQGVDLLELSVGQPSLEDVYLGMMK